MRFDKQGNITQTYEESEPSWLTAKQAAELVRQARSINGEYKRAETRAILERIKTSATNGQSSITLPTMLDTVIIQRLQNLGYRHTTTYGDQRDPSTSVIKWD